MIIVRKFKHHKHIFNGTIELTFNHAVILLGKITFRSSEVQPALSFSFSFFLFVSSAFVMDTGYR